MPTPTIIGARSAQTSSALTVSVPRHPNEQPGDLLIAIGTSYSAGVAITAIPSDFQAWPTALPNLAAISTTFKPHQYLGYASASPPATYDFTFTASSSKNTVMTILTVRGAHPTASLVIDPIVDDRQSSRVTALTLPTLSGLLTGDLVIRALSGTSAGINDAASNTTWPSPLNEEADNQLNGTLVSIASRVMSADGATGTAAVTESVAVAHYGRTFRIVAAPVIPVNTVAPAITGTAHSGSVLTCSDGTWSNSPTGFSKVWKVDGVANGATGNTYTPTVGDEGHAITCTVTATNGGGSSSPATSNSVAIPITTAPVNTVLPQIAGAPQTGQTLVCSSGTWTGGGTISYAYEWRRDGTTILGSGSSYQLQHADEGHAITCRVTATNTAAPGGVVATSDPVTPATTAGIVDADVKLFYSGGSGNASPGSSIGGAIGAQVDLSNPLALFGSIPGTLAASGGAKYAVLYAENTHPFDTLADAALFVLQQETNPGLTLKVAVAPVALDADVPALASNTTAPEGVTFTTATTRETGQAAGSIPPGHRIGLYVELAIAAGTNVDAGSVGKIALKGDPA